MQETFARLLLAMAEIAAYVHEARAEQPGGGSEPGAIPVRERILALHRMVGYGLDEETAPLAVIPGIGAVYARRLRDAGVLDIEELALAGPDRLDEVAGLSQDRAGKWIAAAGELVKSRSAFAYREQAGGYHAALPNWPREIDPYRLRRSLTLVTTPAEGGGFIVRGGLEPHWVHMPGERWLCDCQDFGGGGQVCKHILAVRRNLGDPEIAALVTAGFPSRR